jgi:hypothetical protein
VSAAVPEVGDSVELVFGDDVSIRADVREQLGYAVWLAVPPVIEVGRRLLVRWQVGGRAVSSSARIVRSTARQGLCLAIGTPNRRRRGATRHEPREPLRARLQQGGAVISGRVVDLSFGGCCVAIAAAALPLTAPVTVAFLRPARTHDAPLVDGVDARITAIDAPSGDERHVHVAFTSVGVAAVRISALLGAVRADAHAA